MSLCRKCEPGLSHRQKKELKKKTSRVQNPSLFVTTTNSVLSFWRFGARRRQTKVYNELLVLSTVTGANFASSFEYFHLCSRSSLAKLLLVFSGKKRRTDWINQWLTPSKLYIQRRKNSVLFPEVSQKNGFEFGFPLIIMYQSNPRTPIPPPPLGQTPGNLVKFSTMLPVLRSNAPPVGAS